MEESNHVSRVFMEEKNILVVRFLLLYICLIFHLWGILGEKGGWGVTFSFFCTMIEADFC